MSPKVASEANTAVEGTSLRLPGVRIIGVEPQPAEPSEIGCGRAGKHLEDAG